MVEVFKKSEFLEKVLQFQNYFEKVSERGDLFFFLIFSFLNYEFKVLTHLLIKIGSKIDLISFNVCYKTGP